MKIKRNNIYCGDAADLLEKLDPESVDLTVTSPPYDSLRKYNGYTFDFERIARGLFRATKPGGVVVWIVSDETIDGSETGTSFRQALYFQEVGFDLYDTMIYKAEKPPANDGRYQASFEFMFILSKGKPKAINLLIDKPNKWAGSKNFGKRSQRDRDGSLREGKQTTTPKYSRRLNVWEYPTGRGYSTKDEFAFSHPAIFPEALARDHIISWSNPGDLVLDIFSGSGTTLKEAKKLGRDWIGFDISEEYCQLSRRRVESAIVPLPGYEALYNTVKPEEEQEPKSLRLFE